MITITMVAGCYLLHIQPFEEPLLNNLEAMNEFFTIFLINIIFCFTKIIDDEAISYRIGFIFIGAMSACIAVHLFFLFSDMIRMMILKGKAWWAKRKVAKKFPTNLERN